MTKYAKHITFTTDVRSEPWHEGFDLDGDEILTEKHYIVLETSTGARWEQMTRFNEDQYEKALKEAAYIQETGNVDLCSWRKTDPRYGSIAHQVIGDYHLMDEDDRRGANL